MKKKRLPRPNRCNGVDSAQATFWRSRNITFLSFGERSVDWDDAGENGALVGLAIGAVGLAVVLAVGASVGAGEGFIVGLGGTADIFTK